MNWIDLLFGGIGVFVLGLIVTYCVDRHQKSQQKKEKQASDAENIRIDPKRFSSASENNISADSSVIVLELRSASLKLVCHNLTATPVVIDYISLINADSMDEVKRVDGDSKRIEAHNSLEIDIELPAPNGIPYIKPPGWRCMIKIKTIRDGTFCSEVFGFGDLPKG